MNTEPTTPLAAVDQPRLVRPVEVKHGMVVTDLLNSQNLSAQKRKDASRKGMMSLSDIWPNAIAVAPATLEADCKKDVMAG